MKHASDLLPLEALLADLRASRAEIDLGERVPAEPVLARMQAAVDCVLSGRIKTSRV